MSGITDCYKKICHVVYYDYLRNMGYRKIAAYNDLDHRFERNRYGLNKVVSIDLVELPDSKYMNT